MDDLANLMQNILCSLFFIFPLPSVLLVLHGGKVVQKKEQNVKNKWKRTIQGQSLCLNLFKKYAHLLWPYENMDILSSCFVEKNFFLNFSRNFFFFLRVIALLVQRHSMIEYFSSHGVIRSPLHLIIMHRRILKTCFSCLSSWKITWLKKLNSMRHWSWNYNLGTQKQKQNQAKHK